jgi:hypothetical protein
MDAAEHDLDAKLYKSSAVLLQELQHKLPLLIWHPKHSPKKLRLHVLDHKVDELRLIVLSFTL